MRLSTRLILLVVGCSLPIAAAQLYAQYHLQRDILHELQTVAREHARLADADLSDVLDGVRELGAVIQRRPGSSRGGDDQVGDVLVRDDCAGRLNALRQSLPRYRSIALIQRDNGGLVCGSTGADILIGPEQRARLAEVLRTEDMAVGPVLAAGNDGASVLPVGLVLSDAADSGHTILMAAIDTQWLAKHFAAPEAAPGGEQTAATIFVVDRNGKMLHRVSNQSEEQVLPQWLQPLLARETSGDATVVDEHGRSYAAAFVPAAESHGVAVIALISATTGAIGWATWQDGAVVLAATMAALMLAWLAGQRFIYRPTETLLHAARRWREGDLAARADLPNAGAEFASLAQSFNAMAAGLAARETERKMQASFLEQQVAERTRELSETNNRLQVEIAGREKTEAALHQAQKLQAVGQLAGGIAHDFNNLLATVLGNLELMERRVAQANATWGSVETERLQRLIERAVGAVQRGGQLTSRLLAFSRRQRLAARATDINALVQELITLATSTLGRRVQVMPELEEQLWPAMVDPSQVEAAILNLCLNARDAMPEGGRLTIQTRNIHVAAHATGAASELAPGAYVQVGIFDTGTGMTPEVKARAFEPFFTTKGPGAGSGLGLSQVYGLARQSGGAVHIESELGVGTRVILSLPRAAAEMPAQAPAPEAPQPGVVTPGTRDELILIVDDDHAVRQVTVEMARDLGFEVAQAAGGEQALALVETMVTPPQIILLDYAMPGMNGLQLAHALRERGVTVPIALVTGYAELSEADIQGGELAGLLRKPFTIRELQMLLRQLRVAVEPKRRVLEPEEPAE